MNDNLPKHDTNAGKPYDQPLYYSQSEIQRETKTVRIEMWMYAIAILAVLVLALIAH